MESEAIMANLTHFLEKDQVSELRVLSNDGKKTVFGWFAEKHISAMARDSKHYSGNSNGVYFTPNPLKPELLSRRPNYAAIGKPKQGATTDKDVLKRNFLIIDIDPIRDHDHRGSSATDAEKEHAFELAKKVASVLCIRGWLEPLVVDSGNGCHLYFRLPENDPDAERIPTILQHLAIMYDSLAHGAKIDSSIGNPARIMRVPGTKACKGRNTKERPWRVSSILTVPETWQQKPTKQTLIGDTIVALVELAPLPAPTTHKTTKSFMVGHIHSGATTSYGARALISECGQLAAATENRNNALHEAACNVFELVGGGQIDGQEAHELLTSAALSTGLPAHEVAKTIESAMKRVAYKPRVPSGPEEIVVEGELPEFMQKMMGVVPTTSQAGEGTAKPDLLDALLAPDEVPVTEIAIANTGATATEIASIEVKAKVPPIVIPPFKPSSKLPPLLKNWFLVTVDGENQFEVGRTDTDLVTEIHAKTGGWPKKAGNQLFVVNRTPNGMAIEFLTNAVELFAYLREVYEKTCGKEPSFDWRLGPDKLTRDDLMRALWRRAESFDSIEFHPHEPQVPGVYYCHQPLPTDATGDDLNKLVSMFHPATPIDQELIRAAILTLYWGGEPGQRPGWLITTEDGQDGRGYGKTTFVQQIALLVGGDVSINPHGKREVSTILLTPDAITKRVALIDNLKTRHFSHAEIEGAITGTKIDGNKLYDGYGYRPNLLTWFVTVNGANLSKDLAQRLVPIYLRKPEYSSQWLANLSKFIRERKWYIAADACAELALAGDPVPSHISRHGAWETCVLSKLPKPEELALAIISRKEGTDGDREEAEEVEFSIENAIRAKGLDPELDKVWISTDDLYEIVKSHTSYPGKIAVLRWFYSLPLPQVTKCNKRIYRGCIWNANLSSNARKFDEPMCVIYEEQGDWFVSVAETENN